MVEIKGCLSYGEEECMYVMNVMVYPKTLVRRKKCSFKLKIRYILRTGEVKIIRKYLFRQKWRERDYMAEDDEFKFLYILILERSLYSRNLHKGKGGEERKKRRKEKNR